MQFENGKQASKQAGPAQTGAANQKVVAGFCGRRAGMPILLLVAWAFLPETDWDRQTWQHGNPLMFSYRAPRFILTESKGGDTTVYQCGNNTGERKMIKNLVKHGNSWALVIDRPILDPLQIDPECPVELTTDGSSIRIAAATDDSRKEKLRQASKKVNARYKKTFQKLAE